MDNKIKEKYKKIKVKIIELNESSKQIDKMSLFILIVFCSGFFGAFIIVGEFLYKVVSEIYPLLLLGVFYLIYRAPDNIPNNNFNTYTFNDDYFVTLKCVSKANERVSKFIGTRVPHSDNELISTIYYYEDDISKEKTKNMSYFSLPKDNLEKNFEKDDVRVIFSEELNNQFLRFRGQFVSDVQGLYVDLVDETKMNYEIVITPLNEKSSEDIKSRELDYFRYEHQKKSKEVLEDEEF